MAKTFNNIDDLIYWLIKDLYEFAGSKLATEVKEVYNQYINIDVYQAYEPTSYARRGQLNGGLGDWDNLRANVAPVTYQGQLAEQLSVTNETPGSNPIHPYYARPTGTELMKIVETGKGYQVWHNAFPRPATANTIKQIKETGLVSNLLRSRYPT